MLDWSLPQVSLRPLTVWQRNARVWIKLFWPSLLGNVAEPMLYLLMLGYGLGRFIGEMQGMPYILFLASGFVCASVMNTASFESLYSAYTRMAMQNTWHGMLAAPLSVDDVVIGEVLWAASKSLFSALMIIVVGVGLGVISAWSVLWALPLLFLAGLVFSSMGLVVTAISSSYDFFIYYFTLLITPMFLFCGVFFPLTDLPPMIQWLPQILPLTHVVALVRPLVVGAGLPGDVLLHLAVILTYGVASLWVAIVLIRRRLMS